MKAWNVVLGLMLVACAAPSADPNSLRRGGGGTDNPGEEEDVDAGEAPNGETPSTKLPDGGTPEKPNTPPPPPGVGNLTPGKSTITITAAGQSRSIVLVVPSAITTQAVPLVIALHGNGDSASNFVATRQLEQLSASGGFVVAAPQGIVQNISVGGQQVNGVSWDAYRTLAGGNIDLALLEEIQKELVKPGGQIDAKRVVVFGYSQGGYLSFRYGIDASAKLACAAVVAAASPLGASYVTNATRKIPYALTIGVNDFGISQARAAKVALEGAAHPLQYQEIAGAGHSPFPGPTSGPLDYCLDKSLP
jgi:predicted esterase